jgi:hypothetical protein
MNRVLTAALLGLVLLGGRATTHAHTPTRPIDANPEDSPLLFLTTGACDIKPLIPPVPHRPREEIDFPRLTLPDLRPGKVGR